MHSLAVSVSVSAICIVPRGTWDQSAAAYLHSVKLPEKGALAFLLCQASYVLTCPVDQAWVV